MQEKALLSVRDLTVEINNSGARFSVVSNISFDVNESETVCIVGESGSGKTMTALTLMSLTASPSVRVKSGAVFLDSQNLTALSEQEKQKIRGSKVAMIFQDPMTSLNPVMKIGEQIAEAISAHNPQVKKEELISRSVELLSLVGIPAPRERLDVYPHQMSGGMRQRVLIAMALANKPKLIVADEPTTALDVTVQAQVMEVMRDACKQTGAAVLLITHNMGLVAESADRVLVMYGGRIVESGRVEALFRQPRHPYARSLLASIPRLDSDPDKELLAIEGEPPNLANLGPGCAFRPRCWLAKGRFECEQSQPSLNEVFPGHASACHFAHEMTEEVFTPIQEVSA